MSILAAGEADFWGEGQEEPPVHAGRGPCWARGGPGSPGSIQNRRGWAGNPGWKCCGSSSSSSSLPPEWLQEELRASNVGTNPSAAESFHPLTPTASSSEAPEPGDSQVCPSWPGRVCPPWGVCPQTFPIKLCLNSQCAGSFSFSSHHGTLLPGGFRGGVLWPVLIFSPKSLSPGKGSFWAALGEGHCGCPLCPVEELSPQE